LTTGRQSVISRCLFLAVLLSFSQYHVAHKTANMP
jgi:hypothetical protein